MTCFDKSIVPRRTDDSVQNRGDDAGVLNDGDENDGTATDAFTQKPESQRNSESDDQTDDDEEIGSERDGTGCGPSSGTCVGSIGSSMRYIIAPSFS